MAIPDSPSFKNFGIQILFKRSRMRVCSFPEKRGDCSPYCTITVLTKSATVYTKESFCAFVKPLLQICNYKFHLPSSLRSHTDTRAYFPFFNFPSFRESKKRDPLVLFFLLSLLLRVSKSSFTLSSCLCHELSRRRSKAAPITLRLAKLNCLRIK